MASRVYDVVIVGGGIMGSSTAYYVTKSEPRLSVAVVERDPSYVQASTTLSLSNVRIQFSLKENIQISQYTIEVLKRFEDEMVVYDQKPKISFRQDGNLFLVDESGKDAAQKALGLQQRLGCRVEWWSPKKIKEKYPLYEPVNFAGGTFGPDDGYFDAYAALMGYRAKAKSLGAEYINDEVVEIKTKAGRVTGIALAKNGNLNAKIVINCAGAWATKVADTACIRLPIIPIKRQVFVIDPVVKPEEPLPLTILPSGLYLRTETGGLILMGKSMDEDTVGYEFTWDDKRFMEILWPELTEFVPAFDRGLYAVNTFDGNAILGEWPELQGLYLANGFSGHGLQQAPAVGRYLSELILGRSFSLDLSIFSPERILENKPLSEGGLV
jgi:glycine/D-amino acid oxidase-like deaminating enzyme